MHCWWDFLSRPSRRRPLLNKPRRQRDAAISEVRRGRRTKEFPGDCSQVNPKAIALAAYAACMTKEGQQPVSAIDNDVDRPNRLAGHSALNSMPGELGHPQRRRCARNHAMNCAKPRSPAWRQRIVLVLHQRAMSLRPLLPQRTISLGPPKRHDFHQAQNSWCGYGAASR